MVRRVIIVGLAVVHEFTVLPRSESFYTTDLTKEKRKDLDKVEKSRAPLAGNVILGVDSRYERPEESSVF
jgi:hypothetical protein